MKTLKIGNKVKSSGYDFTVIKIHSDIRKGMVDIRNDRGTKTVDIKDINYNIVGSGEVRMV